MSNWLDRSGYVSLIAVVGGGIVAAIILLAVLFLRGGDDDEPQAPPPTSTAVVIAATPTSAPVTTATATVEPAATPTGSFSTPDDAVASFVQDGLGGPYIGECPPSTPAGETPEGICSIELYRSTELATFNIGPFGSEALGEAVVLPDVDGRWSLVFLDFPPLDAAITIGLDAMVFQAADCLRFRPEPNVAADVSSCQIDGTSGRVVDGPVEADDITWWRLEGLGWASASFLAPVG